MKIIDDKGRLFGKINIIDLIVILIVLAAVAFIGVKSYQNKDAITTTVASNKEDMYVTLVCKLAPESAYNAIEVGDKLLAQNAYTGGEVVEVSMKPGEYVTTDSEGNMILTEHPLYKDITVIVKEAQDPNSPVLKVNGQECRVGAKIFFKTQKVELSSTIEGIEFRK